VKTLTIAVCLPDAEYALPKTRMCSQKASLNKLFEECAVTALAQQDAQASFDMRQARGDRQRGLALLDQLDAHFSPS
jgi:hypothetical protein